MIRAEDLMVGDWYKKKDYQIEEVARHLCEQLNSVYKNPLVSKMVLTKAIEQIDGKDIEGEFWKEMPDYEGLYLISNKGRVKSCSRIKNSGGRFEYLSKEKMLKPSISKDGYLSVYLCKNGKMKYHALHRLVAIAFIPNDGKLSDVNHKDENKLNNVVENLEWCSKAYNTKYGTRTQRTSRRIQQFTKNGEYIQTFNSVKEASRTLGIGSSNIHHCAVNKEIIKNGKSYICRTAGGFIWKYE